MASNISRRDFLKIGGGLVLGLQLPGCGSNNSAETLITNELLRTNARPNDGVLFFPNAFLSISSANHIVFQIAGSEMGQDVTTSLSMLIAEELNVQLAAITAVFAPAHEAFENPKSGRQTTGGSNSIRGFYEPLRKAGAAARQMLLQAAATTWDVDISTCHTENAMVIHQESNRQLQYGELVDAARQLPVPDNIKLKPVEQFKLIGTAQQRLDAVQKVNGSAVYGQDVTLPGLLVATVLRCPVFKGQVKTFDATEAKRIKGVRDIVPIDAGIAIVADNYWSAHKARQQINVEWDEGEYAALTSAGIREQMIQAIDDGKTVRDEGDVKKALPQAAKKLEAVYETPYLAHACMEPMNCTAHVQNDRCDIWVSTQSQESTQKTGAKLTGLNKKQVFVHTTFLGGGFGRRGEQDFVAEAVQLSKIIKAPVKVVWSREDDIQHDFYRPATYNKLTAGIDENGNLTAWKHTIAADSILTRVVPFGGLLFSKDPTSIEGANNLPYHIPNQQVSYARVEAGIPVGFWRSVGNSQNGYITECFIDELAALAGKDPVAFRQSMLGEQPRYQAVLKLAAEKAGWGKSLPDHHYHGVALVKSFDSYVAQVAEVSIQPSNQSRSNQSRSNQPQSDQSQPDQSQSSQMRVHKVVCVVDCGVVINPDTVVAQVEGGIVFGLSAALYGNISIDKGRVVQSNFNDQPVLRISEMPEIDVHIVKSTAPPGGIGEVATPPIAAAVANAVFAATGQPVRQLPIRFDS